jgi:hypothetical protein
MADGDRVIEPGSSSAAASTSGSIVQSLDAVWHGIWIAATSSAWAAAGILVFLVLAMIRVVHAIAHPGNVRDPVRRFSRADKAIVLARAGGRCEHHGWVGGRCTKTELLEADHVHPHSRGGQTNVVNGQALCQRHNRNKRATIPFNWQLQALERRRAGYYPDGTAGAVVRRASRASRRTPPAPPSDGS